MRYTPEVMSSRIEHRRGDSSYDSKDISRAKSILKEDVNEGPLRYFKRRLLSEKKSTIPNLWEGENGLMEHLKDPFPMPEKVTPRKNFPLDGDNTEAGNSSHSQTEVPSCSASIDLCPVQGNSLEGTEHLPKSLPDCAIDTEVAANADEVDRVPTVTEEDDCIILEEEKEIIEIEDDNSDSADCLDTDQTPNSNFLQQSKSLQKKISQLWKKICKLRKRLCVVNKSDPKAVDNLVAIHRDLIKWILDLTKVKYSIDSPTFNASSQTDTDKENNKVRSHIRYRYRGLWQRVEAAIDIFKTQASSFSEGKSEALSFQNLQRDLHKIILRGESVNL